MKKMKSLFSLLIITLLLTNICIAEKPQSRDELSDKYKWNLNDIYPSWEAWEADLNKVDEMFQKIPEFKGKLGSSVETYMEFIKLREEMSKIGTKLGSYSFLNRALDGANTEFNTRAQQLQNMYIKNGMNTAWIGPELKTIPKETMDKWLAENEDLQIYKHGIEDFYREMEHILPEEKQQMMTTLSKALGAANSIYTSISVSDMVYPTVKLSTGEEVVASPAERTRISSTNPNQDDRKLVSDAMIKPFVKQKNTYADIYSGILNARWAQAQIYGYNSCIEAALSSNDIPTDVYLNLIEVAKNNVEPLQKYNRLRKKALGLEHYYKSDGLINITDFNKTYTWEEAEELVKAALEPLGEEYNEKVAEMLQGGRVDVYENQGKRGGAFNLGVYGVHPYILMNYNGTRDNVFTLAHEMGHSIHSVFSCENQEFTNHSYTIFVGEVASTFNEFMLLDYMIKNATDPNEKISLLVQAIENIYGTFYTQSMFAEFEYKAYSMVENSQPLNSEVVGNLYNEVYESYLGETIERSEDDKYYWSRIHHFLSRYYYVYQYATSFSASSKIYAEVKNAKNKKERKAAQDKLLTLLKSGGNDYPVNQLAKAGIDMTTPETFKAVVNQFSELVDQLEQELKALGKI